MQRTEARRQRRLRAGGGLAVVVVMVTAASVAVAVVHGGRDPASASSTPSPGATTPTASPLVPLEIHAVHGASYVPALEGKRPLFILALGSDARPGQGIASQRSDSIHLIGINLKTRHATILGFPRDSWVPIPGHGTNKINSSLSYGGPQLTVKTVEALTGIRIDFWVLTSFSGVINAVNHIGGLTVNIPQNLHDSYSGAHFSKGRQHLDGKQILAFARDRHDFLSGDLNRSANQGAIMLAAIAKLHAVFKRNPAAILKWIAAGYQAIKTDLSVPTLLDLALTATQIPVRNVNNLVVPASTGDVGGQSVVFISASAKSLYTQMRKTGIAGS